MQSKWSDVPLLALLSLFILAASAQAAGNTLFLNDQDFLSSAHGRLSCVRCHDAQGHAKDVHPNVTAFNSYASGAFSSKACYSCHTGVRNDIATGTHAGQKITRPGQMENCVACHNPHSVKRTRHVSTRNSVPATPTDSTRACLTCHGLGTADASQSAPSGDSAQPASSAMCLYCHAASSPIDAPHLDDQATPTHGNMSCVTCHKDAARFPHFTQERVNCLSCHQRHAEKPIHDAHSRVACAACHLSGVTPTRDNLTGEVGFSIASGALRVHDMSLDPRDSCIRCHSSAIAGTALGGGFTPGPGAVGAPASVLPPKGLLCVGCHAGTLTLQDTPSKIGFIIFLLGFAAMGLFCLSPVRLGAGEPTHGNESEKQEGSRDFRGLLLDIFLQRRLYRESPRRWAIHALIFLPFLIRFVWGALAAFGSCVMPASDWPWLLLDKDWSLTALVFDLSGLALLAGLILAGLGWWRETRPAANPPRRDWIALGLLLALTLSGFVLEGMRISLAGYPAGSGAAFVGTLLAHCFGSQATVADWYATAWYVHALFTAATVAWIPFSQLRHIFTTPIFLIIQTIRNRH